MAVYLCSCKTQGKTIPETPASFAFCIVPYRLAGSYEALAGVQIGDALVDFTGGVNEAIKLKTGGVNEAIKLKTGGVNEAIKNTDVNKTKLFEVNGEGRT